MAHKKLKAENNSKAEDAATDALFVLHPDLSRLLRAIRRSTPGQFALYFARCNMPAYRSRLVAALKTRATKPIAEISLAGLPLLNQTLDDALLSRLRKAPDDAVLFVYDLDSLLPHHHPGQQEAVLLQLNWRRSAFARLQRTLVFWLPEHALQLLHSQAPDFADWYSGIYEFDVPDNAKSEAVQDSLQGFYSGDVHAADRLNADEKQRWIEVLHNLLEDGLPAEEQAGLWNDLGRVYASIGHYDAALRVFKKAYALSRQSEQKKLESAALNNISHISYARGDYGTSLDYLNKSLLIQQEIGDQSGEGTTLNNISQIYAVRGNYDIALDYLKKSLILRQRVGDKSGENATLNNIGQIYNVLGDFEVALDCLKKSLSICQEISDRSGECITLNNISHIYYVRGNYDVALVHLKKSLIICQDIGDKLGESTAYNNIAQVYVARGDYFTAFNFLNKSLTIRQEIGNKLGEGNTLYNIAQIYAVRRDYDTALDYLKKSLLIRQEIDDMKGLCATRFNMGHIFWQSNQQDEALQQWVEVYRVAKKIQLVKALQVLEKLANDLELPGGGLDAWEVLAREQDSVHPDAVMRDNEKSEVR